MALFIDMRKIGKEQEKEGSPCSVGKLNLKTFKYPSGNIKKADGNIKKADGIARKGQRWKKILGIY